MGGSRFPLSLLTFNKTRGSETLQRRARRRDWQVQLEGPKMPDRLQAPRARGKLGTDCKRPIARRFGAEIKCHGQRCAIEMDLGHRISNVVCEHLQVRMPEDTKQSQLALSTV
jgi:hypothetical protein